MIWSENRVVLALSNLPRAAPMMPRAAPRSRCHDGGIGLTYGECDDPFCRQQSGPPRHFCHGSAVVSCSGTGPSTAATPHTVQYCSDRQSNQNGHKVTEHYTCQESY